MKDWLNIDKLEYNTYDEYKDSKIEWLGYIPNHYDTKKLKKIVNIKKGNTIEQFDDEKSNRIPLLNLDYLRNREKNYFFVDSNKSIKINKGEILIVWDGSACGEFIKTKKEGALSSTLAVLRTKNNYNVEFLYYLNYTFNDYLSKNFNGMGIPHVNSTLLKNLLILIPSKKEQLAIVKFLDEKTTIIDKKIEILKKQNELEKELEKVLINQCVTKGVDSFTKLDKNGNLIDFDNKLNRNKEEFDLYMNENGYIDSKVEWLGYININCKLSKMKFEVKNANNGKNNSNDTPVLSLTKTGVKIKTDITFGKCATSYIGHQIVNIGNFVFSPRDYDQTPIVSGVCYDYGCTSNLYMVFNVNCDNISEYINIWFWNLKYLVNYFENFSQGMRYSFNGKTFGEIPFIKYNKKEQFKIIKFLDSKAQILEQKRIKREIEITLLEEYKKTLINDVVTGKIKVIKC